MKTVIIEDEKAAVRNLTSLLNEVKPEAEIIAILDSINSTIEWFGIHPMPELVFMDIHLADGSAFEIFDHISITCPIHHGLRRICPACLQSEQYRLSAETYRQGGHRTCV